MRDHEKWFSVRLLLESVHRGQNGPRKLFEDRIVLVKSMSLEAAREKAESICKQKAEEYENPYGEVVSWQFREILDAKELVDETIRDGIEVYYNHINESEVDQLRRMLLRFQE